MGSELDALTVITPTNAWAVGFYDPTGDGESRPLIVHWDGQKWSRVKVPYPRRSGQTLLTGVDAVAPDDVWATGQTGQNGTQISRTFVVHWNGVSWHRVPSASEPQSTNHLVSVAAMGRHDVWAVGGYKTLSGASMPLIEHCAKRRCDEVGLPKEDRKFVLEDVSGQSANNVWAVERYS
jgi:hypothetical protein